MCYHVSNESDVETLRAEFKLPADKLEKFKKKYDFNGFEKPFLPVISMENPREMDLYRWRLVPGNVADEKDFKFNTLNASNHELFNREKMWWRHVKNRCLVLCTGFFEPHYPVLGKKEHESWYIKPRDKKFFAMAGIYSRWNGMNTFSIVTQDASPMMREIHNDGARQPLLLRGNAALSWLIPELSEEEIRKLTYFQYPEDKLEAYRTIDGIYNAKVDTNVPGAVQPFQPYAPAFL